MAKKPHKYTKKLQFDIKTRERIIERDGGCIFCMMGYPTKDATWLEFAIKDIMHFVPKSQMGLGVEQNGALGCRYHHSKLENGNGKDGFSRKEMLERFESYLRSIYPDWNKEDLVYKKYDF